MEEPPRHAAHRFLVKTNGAGHEMQPNAVKNNKFERPALILAVAITIFWPPRLNFLAFTVICNRFDAISVILDAIFIGFQSKCSQLL